MPSLTAKERVSLRLFSFTDGRRCRTPRTDNHPHFCFYHAQKETRARAAETLGKDLAYFFSGDYLSACDLSTALSRLIPAVIRGNIKPRLARTVAYMFQTQLQAIRLSQHEYINAFGTDGWRKAVRTSVNVNFDYRFPHDAGAEPKPQQPQSTQSQRTHPQPQRPTASSPQPPSRPQTPAAAKPQPPRAAGLTPAQAEAALSVARSLFPRRPDSATAQPAAPTTNSALRLTQLASSSNHPAAPARACHPERGEGPCLNPASSTIDETRLASAPAQSAQPNNTPPPAPPRTQTRPTAPNHDPYAVHFDHNYRLHESPKLL